MSERAVRRLQELQRKFDNPGLLEPRGIEVGWVASPIPESSASKMSDDEWLGAIQRYSSISPSNEPARFFVGGVHELSQLLEAQTKEDPARFAKLVQLIPDNSNTSYFEAVLRGLDGADIEMEAMVQACLRCHQIPGGPLGRLVTRPSCSFFRLPTAGQSVTDGGMVCDRSPQPGPRNGFTRDDILPGRQEISALRSNHGRHQFGKRVSSRDHSQVDVPR